jgi:hypothetical protein
MQARDLGNGSRSRGRQTQRCAEVRHGSGVVEAQGESGSIAIAAQVSLKTRHQEYEFGSIFYGAIHAVANASTA